MIKQTKAYRAALVLLADALARQDAAAVISSIQAGEIILDLDEVLERRHPDFYAAMDDVLGGRSSAASRPASNDAAPL